MPKFSLATALWIFETSGDEGLENIVRSVAAAGFHACELFGLQVEPPVDVAAVRRVLNRHGVRAQTIHPPIGETNLSALDEDRRRASVAEISACFEPFAALGGFAAIVHPSGGLTEWEAANRAAHVESFRRSLDELLRMAEALGIRLACENLQSKGQPRALCRMEELRAVIDGYPPDVGLCLDTGHANNNGLNPADEARMAGERLIALHLQDTDGVEDRHWVPGRGTVNWAQLHAALIEIGFNGAWTFEILARNGESEALVQDTRRVADAWAAGRF